MDVDANKKQISLSMNMVLIILVSKDHDKKTVLMISVAAPIIGQQILEALLGIILLQEETIEEIATIEDQRGQRVQDLAIIRLKFYRH